MKFKSRPYYHLSLSRMSFYVRFSLLLALSVSWILTAGCAQPKKAEPKATPEVESKVEKKVEFMEITPDPDKAPLSFNDLEPVTPPPNAAVIQGGLKVWYWEDFFVKHVTALPKGDPPFSWGFKGEPLPILDRKFALGEKFYNSGHHRGISCLIRGMINFSEPGEYVLIARSNDGIRIWLGDKKVIDDPDWHGAGDEPTPEAKITITKTGWYRFRIKFFQRKGTATLQMYWKQPGDRDFSYIPAEAYGHLPD